MRFLFTVIIVLIGGLFSAHSSLSQPQQTAPAKQYFIAIFSRGPAWDAAKPPNEQVGFKEHSANLQRLRSEKKIPIGGRYSDKGMVIVEAQSVEEAQSLFSSDVMVTKKTFNLELHNFRPFYKGSIE
jgi:uncharacterized protein YciI